MDRLVRRDEREAGVDMAADRLAYLVLSYGLLAVVAYRAFVGRESSWDLLGLIVLGGIAGAGYRAWHQALTGRWALVVGITIGVALAVGAAVAFFSR